MFTQITSLYAQESDIMAHPLYRTAVWSLLIVGLMTATSSAQSELPTNWQSLSPTDFANEMKKHYLAAEDHFYFDLENEVEVRQHAATLLSQIDMNNTTLGYETIDVINGLAYPYTEKETQSTTKEILLAKTDDWTGRPYAEARAKFSLLDRNHASWNERNGLSKRGLMREVNFKTYGPMTYIACDGLFQTGKSFRKVVPSPSPGN
ncbi:MAG: hypothetical protein R3C11_27195 [Planctomycetaceae bacterium]